MPQGVSAQPPPPAVVIDPQDNWYNRFSRLYDGTAPQTGGAFAPGSLDYPAFAPFDTGYEYTAGVDLLTGVFRQTHDLVTYYSAGATRGVTLVYDSLRADSRPIVHFGYDDLSAGAGQYLIASMSLRRGDDIFDAPGLDLTDEYAAMGLEGGENFWLTPALGGRADAALQVDMLAAPTGIYTYFIDHGIYDFTGGQFVAGAGTPRLTHDRIAVVNEVDSPFGAGWGIDGLDSVIVETDGYALLTDGGGDEGIFAPPLAEGSPYVSPVGDFSILQQNAVTGQFSRRMPDGTVYHFRLEERRTDGSELHLLDRIIDANGNETRFAWAGGRLDRITDSVGLVTTFGYFGSTVVITDPAGRPTKLELDGDGNLVRITDPDGSMRQFSYDNHLLTTEIDKRNNIQCVVYDPDFGRAVGLAPAANPGLALVTAQMQNLFTPDATDEPFTTVVQATGLPQKPLTSVEELEGDAPAETWVTLSKWGLVDSSADEFGAVAFERDERGFTRARTDERGYTTRYELDERGNLVWWQDDISAYESYDTLFALLAGSVSGADAPISHRDLDAGSTPVAASLGDLDGDGNSDLVVANGGGSGVTILRGNGDGTFYDRRSFELDLSPATAALGDLDRDGKPDVVLAHPAGDRVMVWYGTGAGSFGRSEFLAVGDQPETLAIGDVNGDGRLDIVAANRAADTISVLLARSSGGFATQRVYPVGDEPAHLALVDVDGDGVLDAVTANASGSVSVLRGNGLGGFGPAVNTNVGHPATALAVADFDADGWLDLAIPDAAHDCVSVFLGDGVGGFVQAGAPAVGDEPTFVVAGDLDNDGHVDLVAANKSAGTFTVLLGRGDGTFAVDNEYAAGAGAAVLLVVDIEGDGDRDAMVLNRTAGTVSVRLNGTTQPDGSRLGGIVGGAPATQYSGTRIEYHASLNKPVRIVDALGREVRFELNAGGSPLRQTFVNSHTSGNLTYGATYTANSGYKGLVWSQTDPLGYVTTYSYDSQGRLESITWCNNAAAPEKATRRFEYNGIGGGNTGNVTAEIDENGNRTEYEYDAMNRVTLVRTFHNGQAQETAIGYDAAGNPIRQTDARNATTTYDLYDPANRLRQMTLPDGYAGQVQWQYNAGGDLASRRDPGPGIVTNYTTYDSRHRLKATVGPEGAPTQFDYDATNNVTRVLDPNSQPWSSSYDGRSRTVTQTDPLANAARYVYDKGDRLLAVVDANGHVWRYEYDFFDHLIAEIDPLGNRTEYTYDAAGNLDTVTDARGNVTDYDRDGRGRTVLVTDALLNRVRIEYDAYGNERFITWLDMPGQPQIEKRYDDRNRLEYSIDAEGNMTQYAYDAVGNLTTVTDPRGKNTSYGYDALNRRTTVIDHIDQSTVTTYDSAGNVESLTDRNGNTTRYTYYKDGRGKETIFTLDSVEYRTLSTYDAAGNLKTFQNARTDLPCVTTYFYNQRGDLDYVLDAENGKTSYTYDKVGNQLAVTDRWGATTRYDYDAANRLYQVTDALGYATTYALDEVGNVKAVIPAIADRRTDYTYDALNRVYQQTDAKGNAATYHYDAMGSWGRWWTAAASPRRVPTTRTVGSRARRSPQEPSWPPRLLTPTTPTAASTRLPTR